MAEKWLTIRVDSRDKSALAVLASQEDRSVSSLVRQAIAAFLATKRPRRKKR